MRAKQRVATMPLPYRIGVYWVIVDRLTPVRRNRAAGARHWRHARGRLAPEQYWTGTGWAGDFLHALTFNSEAEARTYLARTFIVA